MSILGSGKRLKLTFEHKVRKYLKLEEFMVKVFIIIQARSIFGGSYLHVLIILAWL